MAEKKKETTKKTKKKKDVKDQETGAEEVKTTKETPKEEVIIEEGTIIEEEETINQGKQATGDEEEPLRTVLGDIGDSVGKFASKTVDSIKQTIDKSLISRNTVLTIRVTDEANRKLSMLVDAGLFKSRSESAAFLIEKGIIHQENLFEKIGKKLETIEKLKDELKDIISEEMK